MMRKNKLAAAVVMSVLACSVCQSVWADDRVSVSADGKTLTLKNINANNTANTYFKEKNGVYVIAKDDGSSFDKIEHSDSNAYSGDGPFISASLPNTTYDILANEINLLSTSNSAISFDPFNHDSVINIGNENKQIKNLHINAGHGYTAGTIAIYGNNNNINFYVDEMLLKLNKALGDSYANSALALGIGEYANNCEININAASKLEIVGDIGNGVLEPERASMSKNSSIKINADPAYNGSVQITGNILKLPTLKTA